MFLLVVRKEVLAHVLSLRFAVTFVLFMVLVFASFYVAVNEHARLVERETAMARAAEKRLDEVMKTEDVEDRVHALFWWEGRTDAVPVSRAAHRVSGPTVSSRSRNAVSVVNMVFPFLGLMRHQAAVKLVIAAAVRRCEAL